MGGVVTTALDLLKWDCALAGTSVLGAAAKKRLFKPAKDGYACGWYVGQAENGAERQLHGGSVRGFVCEMRRFPATNACIVVLANTDSVKYWELGENLECLLFARALRHPVPASVALAPEELATFAGSFESKDGRLVVRVEGGALVAGIEGQALLTALAPSRPSAWKADLAECSKAAVAIVEAIGRGNVEPLRARTAKSIPARWPDDVRSTVYPAHEKQHGRLKAVRALGACYSSERVEIVLALEHETSLARVRIAFSSEGLEILDWDGPSFPATLRLLPQGGTKFVVAGDSGKQRSFEFARKNGRVSGLNADDIELRRKD